MDRVERGRPRRGGPFLMGHLSTARSWSLGSRADTAGTRAVGTESCPTTISPCHRLQSENCYDSEEEDGRRMRKFVLGRALCQRTCGRGLAVRERGEGEGVGFGVPFSNMSTYGGRGRW